ncbi:MAG: NAD(P)/FAD-dependent oxidoreductase [Verrucomicrobiota bacterium]
MPPAKVDSLDAGAEPGSELPRVLVLGGGFGGMAACKCLADMPVQVTLVDRENHHLFQPLLYQVATAGLSAADIAQPLRHIFAQQKNLVTLMEEVVSIDLKGCKVELKGSSLSYDYLVIGLGVVTGYFGNNDWARFAPGLKTLDEATELRRRILLAFERAENSAEQQTDDAWLSFLVVGGGPTGVELAGAVAELARYVLAREFRRIDPAKTHVYLIEAGPRLLPAFKEAESDYTQKRLEKMGVTVRLNSPVSAVRADGVTVGEEFIPAETVLWAAGVEGNPVARELSNVSLDRGGRIMTDASLTVPGHENAFVVGDLAKLEDAKGKPVPGVAPAAMQMGRHVGEQIRNELRGKPRKPFVYFDKGNLATIGRSSAVAEVRSFTMRGYFAWVAWLGVHLIFLFGMRNRISVFLHWVWSYFTWQRGARIITKKLPGRRNDEAVEGFAQLDEVDLKR